MNRLVVLLVAAAAVAPLPTRATERAGEADARDVLQRYGQVVLDLRSDFVDFGRTAKAEDRFALMYVAKEAELAFLHVYHVRTVLDLAIVATSSNDERVIRFVLRREAKDTITGLDMLIDSAQSTKGDFRTRTYLERLDQFLAALRVLRSVVQGVGSGE